MQKLRRKISLLLGLAAASVAGIAAAGKTGLIDLGDGDLDKIVGAGGGTIGGRHKNRHPNHSH